MGVEVRVGMGGLMVVPTVFFLSRCAERDKDGRVGRDKGVKGWEVIGDEEGGRVIDAGARHPMPEYFSLALSLTFDLQCSHLSSRLENLSSLDQRSQKDAETTKGVHSPNFITDMDITTKIWFMPQVFRAKVADRVLQCPILYIAAP